jgi:hypothetical protein
MGCLAFHGDAQAPQAAMTCAYLERRGLEDNRRICDDTAPQAFQRTVSRRFFIDHALKDQVASKREALIPDGRDRQ